MPYRHVTHSAEETINVAIAFGKKLRPNTILCLYGDLGAGKTTFVKGIAASQRTHTTLIHSQDCVSSPTFQYLNIYPAEAPQLPVYHFDLYRLTDCDAFLSMGFDEYLFDRAITCIEWPERIASIIPAHALAIRFLHEGNETRIIELPHPL